MNYRVGTKIEHKDLVHFREGAEAYYMTISLFQEIAEKAGAIVWSSENVPLVVCRRFERYLDKVL